MQVVADSVESEAVWGLLRELGEDGGRGYWLARPQVTR
jgi:EAL domain-containing protein (putative c-di-GMP-specific phosphodiesterase class I)